MKPSIAALFVLVVLGPASAWAGNGTHPRTPVEWSGAPCMTIIDRSVSPIHAFGYAIPYEDTMVTPDEVPGSRSHQFFAFCRDHHLEEIIPGWITEAEPVAAAAAGLGNLEGIDLELDVLENNPEWAGCWARITGDDERRPITFAAAAEPVSWDTTALPAGTWVVEGYTYEPWFNMWSPHPGVFKIVDDPDPAASPPAAALTFAEQTVYFGDSATISGCVDAMPGTTMRFSWALSAVGDEPIWTEFASEVPVEGSAFELPFAPPLEAVSTSVMIRVELVDPMNRAWTAEANSYIAVVEDLGGDETCDEGGFIVDPCDTGTDTSTDAGTGSGTEGASDEVGPGASEGGGCVAGERGSLATLGLLLVVFAGRRRRARAA